MSSDDDAAYLLAKIRATRTLPYPRDARELGDLHAATNQVGQVLTEVRDECDDRALMASWPATLELLGQEANEPYFRRPTSTQLYVLAACIRWCWPDPDKPLYPGVPAAESEILDSLQALSFTGSSQHVRKNHRTALRQLMACGLIWRSVEGGLVKLGPAIALWSEDDVAVLRAEHHRLPGPEGF